MTPLGSRVMRERTLGLFFNVTKDEKWMIGNCTTQNSATILPDGCTYVIGITVPAEINGIVFA